MDGAGQQDMTMHTAQEIIHTTSRTGADLRTAFFRDQAEALQQAALQIARGLAAGGRLFVVGEGSGDICAREMARIFLDHLDLDRPALPAVRIAADGPGGTAGATCARQLEALARPGDMLLAFLPDVERSSLKPALELAQRMDLACILLCGRAAGALALPGITVTAPQASASLSCELLFAAGHLVCRLTDYYLFENVAALQAADPLREVTHNAHL